MAKDSREKLSTIRSTQGWRVAYKVANLKDEGSDATKRKRLSRVINKRTSGYKPLTKTQSTRINRSYGQRKKQIKVARGELSIKRLDRFKALERKYYRGKLARGELSEAAAARRIRRAAPLDDAQKQAIRDAALDEEWDSFRAEYTSQISTVSVSAMPLIQQDRFMRTQDKAQQRELREYNKKHDTKFRTWIALKTHLESVA